MDFGWAKYRTQNGWAHCWKRIRRGTAFVKKLTDKRSIIETSVRFVCLLSVESPCAFLWIHFHVCKLSDFPEGSFRME